MDVGAPNARMIGTASSTSGPLSTPSLCGHYVANIFCRFVHPSPSFTCFVLAVFHVGCNWTKLFQQFSCTTVLTVNKFGHIHDFDNKLILKLLLLNLDVNQSSAWHVSLPFTSDLTCPVIDAM